MMEKIAFIDLGFHKRTKSSDFFQKIISEKYSCDIFYETQPKSDYDIYIYWQVYPEYFDLIKLKGKTIIFCPMYDGINLIKPLWKRFKNLGLKVICFSRKVYEFFYSMGFDCLYIQYYLEPLDYEVDYNRKKLFFWYRGNITWKDVKTVIGDQKVEITIKNNPDPGYKPLDISEEDIKKYKIVFQNKFFDSKDDYYKIISKHSIFIAPRKKEGIGMSFLESMSIGQCVIGYDEATMNEYIENGVNGFLTDFSEQVDLSNYSKIGKECKEKYIISYKEYLSEKEKLVKFFEYKNNFKITFLDYAISLLIKMLKYFLSIRK